MSLKKKKGRRRRRNTITDEKRMIEYMSFHSFNILKVDLILTRANNRIWCCFFFKFSFLYLSMTSFVKLIVAIHSRKQVDLYASLLIYIYIYIELGKIVENREEKNIYTLVCVCVENRHNRARDVFFSAA